jgi:ABC-2 type transport system permease protein
MLTSSPLRPRVVAAIVRREYQVARSYRFALSFGLVYGVLNLALYYYISKVIDSRPGVDLEGAPSYFAFAAVGVAIAVVFQASSTSLARRVREEQLTGTLEALVAQPIAATEIALGLVGFPFLFATARVAFYLLAAAALLGLDLSHADPVGAVLVLLTSGTALTGFGIALGAVVLLVKRGTALVGFMAFLATFVSGAYFPLSVLPDWLQAVAELIPIRFAFEGARAALLRGEGWGGDVLALVVFSAVALPVSLWLFQRALQLTQARGSLSEY